MARPSEAAAALRRVLDDPIYNKTLRKEVGRGELDYEAYLRTKLLLSLQTRPEQMVVPDELLFQVTHQTQELWLKCAAYEAATLVDTLDHEDLFGALASLERIVQMSRVLGDQLRVLFTLSPSRFQIMRRSLGNGGGLESPGYNHLLAAADAAREALERLVARRGVTLLQVYEAPDDHPDLHRIAEGYVDWDGAFQAWLVEHFMVVRRTIGIDKTVRTPDGMPTVELGTRMTRPLFAELWQVRIEMTRAWSRGGAERLEIELEAAASPPDDPTPVARGSRAVIRTGELALAASISSRASLRGEFPVLSRCVYLNSNANGATPRAAKAALDGYWATLEGWRDEVWQQWWGELGAHADELAALIGALPGSVVCDTNLATLFGRVMSCFDFRRRPVVVTSDLEFPSISFVVRAFRRYGVVPVEVPSRDGAAIDVEQIARTIDERTQLVCLSHATFATGALLDAAPIVRRAHEVGALVVLDAYQSVGVVPIDVTALDVDFVLGGAHKWLCGSYESAFLYIRPSLLLRLEPAATGWTASADPLSLEPPFGWADTARRFAGGTPAVLPSLFSRPGLRIVRELGVDAIRGLSLARTDQIIARADAAGISVLTPRPHARRGGIVALRFPGDAEIARSLIADGFVCSHRGGLRIAPHFYNTDEEIDRFMDELVRRAREVQ
jgi:kynureninase